MKVVLATHLPSFADSLSLLFWLQSSLPLIGLDLMHIDQSFTEWQIPRMCFARSASGILLDGNGIIAIGTHLRPGVTPHDTLRQTDIPHTTTHRPHISTEIILAEWGQNPEAIRLGAAGPSEVNARLPPEDLVVLARGSEAQVPLLSQEEADSAAALAVAVQKVALAAEDPEAAALEAAADRGNTPDFAGTNLPSKAITTQFPLLWRKSGLKMTMNPCFFCVSVDTPIFEV